MSGSAPSRPAHACLALRPLVLSCVLALSAAVSVAHAAPPGMAPRQSLPTDGTWTIAFPAGPVVKAEYMAAYDPTGDRMVLFGDLQGTGDSGETWLLQFQPTLTWQLLTIQHPSARSSGIMVYDPIGARMLLFGGYDGNYQNDVWQLSLGATPVWSQLTPSGVAPTPRHWAAGAFDPVGNRFIVIGGYHGGPTYNDVWALNLNGTPTWEQLQPGGATFPAMYGHEAAYDPNGDRIMVWGPNGLWQLQLRPTLAWSQPATTGAAPPASSYGSMVCDAANNRLLVMGGYNGAALPVGPRELSLAAMAWRALSPAGSAPNPRYTFTGVMRSTSVVVYGGRGNIGTEVGTLSTGQATSVAFTSLANAVPCGQSASFRVAVNPASATGTVDIREGNQVLGTAPLDDGMGVVTVNNLSPGSHTLNAGYEGDSQYLPNLSGPLTQIVGDSPTRLACVPDANPAFFGHTIHYTATLAPFTATGTVTFYINGAPFVTSPLSGGVATASLAGAPVGSMEITAIYGGDPCDTASQAQPFTQYVNPAPTSVTVSAHPAGAILGDTVQVTIQLTPATATGTVILVDGSTTFATLPLAGGAAQIALTGLAMGYHSIVATYSGDPNHLASAGAAALAVVTPYPSIAAVRDVRNDQGGRVTLAWQSHADTAGFRRITGYRVWRRAPAVVVMGRSQAAQALRAIRSQAADGTTEISYWEAVASLPAEQLVNYAYTAATLQDSMPDDNPWTAFFVTALTADPYVFYESPVDSGYSVDNLPPATPGGFLVAYAQGAIALHWSPNHESDFAGYHVYRGDTPDFVPSTATLIATTADTGLVDTAPLASYYKLSAVDIHGDESPFAIGSLAPILATPGPVTPIALAVSAPNPSTERGIDVTFALPSGAPARLVLVDVAGHVVDAHDVGGCGPGRHTLRLTPATARSGVLFLRLEQGGLAVTRKFVIVR